MDRPSTSAAAEERSQHKPGDPPHTGAPQLAGQVRGFRYWLMVASSFAVAAVAVWLLYQARDALLVVAASLMLAIGLDPLLDWFESKGWSRGLGMGTAVLAGLAVVGLIVAAIGPPLVTQISEFGEAIPDLIDELRSSLPSSLAGALGSGGDLGTTLSEGLVGLGSSMSNAFGFIVKLTFVGVLGPYLAVSLPSMVRGGTRLLPHEKREDFLRSVNASTTLVGNYVLGNIAISVLAGVVAFVGLSLLGVPFALALAVWIAVVDAIPAIGASLGAIPALFVAATSGLGTLIGVLVFFVIYQQLENHLVIPLVMRRAVSISPAAVLIAILVGGAVAGVFGVILAVPMVALLKVLVFERLMHDRIISLNGDTGGSNKSSWWRPGARPGTRPLP